MDLDEKLDPNGVEDGGDVRDPGDVPCCCVDRRLGMFPCTRPVDHAGDHAAWGLAPALRDHLHARWAQ